LGAEGSLQDQHLPDAGKAWGLKAGTAVGELAPLFPRIEQEA